ncbi:hypothetical protein SAMN04487891_11578 [Flagellimonas taeanensis]|uniref:Uncharacterized protein n=1 Tax=Flagellimonas taeanensis TaxID=1005926 RepID=A0A1M7CF96_9FLAO|nr:hypothetical protein SAMN04487891_11578 [Allomuricauda taeanensis]SHL65884.1 hypothetical protein SAMN05216293_4009 [Allomuricauda taeanensis]
MGQSENVGDKTKANLSKRHLTKANLRQKTIFELDEARYGPKICKI